MIHQKLQEEEESDLLLLWHKENLGRIRWSDLVEKAKPLFKYNYKLAACLKRLEEQELIRREEVSHKNVYYVPTDNLNLLKKIVDAHLKHVNSITQTVKMTKQIKDVETRRQIFLATLESIQNHLVGMGRVYANMPEPVRERLTGIVGKYSAESTGIIVSLNSIDPKSLDWAYQTIRERYKSSIKNLPVRVPLAST